MTVLNKMQITENMEEQMFLSGIILTTTESKFYLFISGLGGQGAPAPQRALPTIRPVSGQPVGAQVFHLLWEFPRGWTGRGGALALV